MHIQILLNFIAISSGERIQLWLNPIFLSAVFLACSDVFFLTFCSQLLPRLIGFCLHLESSLSSLQSSCTLSARSSALKREVCSHAWNNKGEENTTKESPEFARAVVSITALYCLWCTESSWGFDCREDRDRLICCVSGYLCGKQQGLGYAVVTSKTWSNGYAIATMLIFVVWSNLLEKGGQPWGESTLPTLCLLWEWFVNPAKSKMSAAPSNDAAFLLMKEMPVLVFL